VESWSRWSKCTQTCGGGHRERSRDVIPGTPGGEECPRDLVEREYCNENPCVVDGEWSAWNAWSKCEVKCGGGIRIRKRSCNDPAPSDGGDDCRGSAIEVEECNSQKCKNSDCGPYKEWSYKCKSTLSCHDAADSDALVEPEICQPGCRCIGNLVMTQNGECVQPRGHYCECYDQASNQFIKGGDVIISDDGCSSTTCSDGSLFTSKIPCDRDCGYSNWGEFGICSAEVDGFMRRFRVPNSPPALGYGKICNEPVFDDAPCGEEQGQACKVGRKEYPVLQIIPDLSTPCEKDCYCNIDGQVECTDISESCEPCLPGFELQPSDRDCCKCVPVQSECSLRLKYDRVEIEDEDGNICTSASKEVYTTTCEGACTSRDESTFKFSNGYLVHKKECKCCSGVDPQEPVSEMFNCSNGKTIYVKIQNFNRCECDSCVAAYPHN